MESKLQDLMYFIQTVSVLSLNGRFPSFFVVSANIKRPPDISTAQAYLGRRDFLNY